MGNIPANVSRGLVLGEATAFFFFIANLYVILHFLQTLLFPKADVTWLKAMGKRWHYVHYFGNIAAAVAALVHGLSLLPYASVWHGVLIALLVWMVGAGVTMRFIKVPPAVKKTLRKFHAKWYMLAIIIVVLLLAHVVSLQNFPYPVG